MQMIRIKQTPLIVSRLAQGCMRISDDPKKAVATIRAALDQGITLFDHADIYNHGQSETVFSAIWEEASGLRERIVLQSKCGLRFAGQPQEWAPWRFDFSYEHIIEAVEGSLSRLKTDYLDLLLLHRPDALVEPEEVARAFDQLQQQGKVRFFGVSNHTPGQIDLLKRWIDQPLVVNQLQLSLIHHHLIDEGIVMNCDEPLTPTRGESTLDYCRLHDITVQAWSPLAAGAVTGKGTVGAEPRIVRTAEVVARMASEKGVNPGAILIAWLLRHPAGIQPVIGTTDPQRIAGVCQADEVELSREEWYLLFEAGRGGRLP